ncbi:MAG: sensor histidine kinase [Candidatus Marinarcus sp.]|uniref:sensor histidine kinase n=1 Tax=Candidatus Marinarcus sp. TaxID=3100987 RepID=UPI003B00BB5E
MKFFILFFIFITSIFAHDLDVVEKYFVDTNHSLNIEEIIKHKDNFIPIKEYNLGMTKSSVWVKINLKNNTKQNLRKRINNKIAGINLIDVFLVKDNQITKTYKLGNLREHNNRENNFRTSYFDIELQPLEKTEIFIKQKTYGTMDIRWDIINIKDFETYYFFQGLIYAFFTGVLLVMIVLGFTLYFIFKKKHFLIYSLFTISIGIFQLTVAGFLYQLGLSLDLNKFFIFFIPAFSMILFGLFPLYFFNIQKNECRITQTIIKTSIVLLTVFAFTQFFYRSYPDVLYYLKFYVYIIFILMLTILIFSIRMFFLKKDGSIFYLLANSVYFFFAGLYMLVSFGILKYEGFLYYFLSVGAIGQDVVLAIGLIYSVYVMRKRNEKNIELLGEYSKLSFIGQTMINISHQWKEPINNIYSSITYIEAAREFKDKNIDTIIDNNLKIIKETTSYLKETALGQLHFYKEEKNIEEVEFCEEINYVIKLMENEFLKKDIKISFDCNDKIKIKIEKNYFLNVLMILFENSLKAFERRKIKSPKIRILVKEIETKLEIIFEDNAGGVSKDFIEKIFEKNFSESSSTGIGLYLAKEIVSQKLKGQITAENRNEGLSFKIVI